MLKIRRFFSFVLKIVYCFFLMLLIAKPVKDEDDILILKIDSLGIWENVYQYSDNAYYLNHDRYGDKSLIGELFLDYRVREGTDRQVIIYGHNSPTFQIPFRKLENFYEEDFFYENSLIQLLVNNVTYDYEIFSIFVEFADWRYLKLYNSDEEFIDHLYYLRDKSWFKKDFTFDINDKLLILQTCSYHKNYKKYDKKYLVIAAILRKS